MRSSRFEMVHDISELSLVPSISMYSKIDMILFVCVGVMYSSIEISKVLCMVKSSHDKIVAHCRASRSYLDWLKHTLYIKVQCPRLNNLRSKLCLTYVLCSARILEWRDCY
jgi:hypothetical protein